MVKNITVGISDELANRMEEYKEVNWSAITRVCIEQYINQRSSDQFEKAIAEVKSKKNIGHQSGFNFVFNKIEKIDLGDLEYIANFKPTDADELKNFFSYLTDLAYKIEPRLNEFDIKISSSFVEGMWSAAEEILKRSR